MIKDVIVSDFYARKTKNVFHGIDRLMKNLCKDV